jgi:hypothetical protein
MAQPPLDRPGIVALVGEGVAAGVAKHVTAIAAAAVRVRRQCRKRTGFDAAAAYPSLAKNGGPRLSRLDYAFNDRSSGMAKGIGKFTQGQSLLADP